MSKKINLMLVALVLALVVALGLVGKMAWDKRELGKANSALNEQLMQANLEIGRGHTMFGNAEAYAKDLEEGLQAEINARNAEITRYGELLAKYNISKESKGKGEIVYIAGPKTKGDKFTTGQLYTAIDERTLKAIGRIEAQYQDTRIDALCRFVPDPSVAPHIPFEFNYNLHLVFGGELVETLTPSGAINHYFNLWELDEDGERLERLEITKFNIVVNDQRATQFYWWAPHLDVGILLGFRGDGQFSMGGSLGVSAMGFGLTENDLSWRFLRLSMDLAAQPGVGFSPVQYNMGEFIPLISNMWLSPHFTYFLSKDREWMLGIMTGAVL